MKKLLLSVCCAPCATVAIERLKDEYDVTLFFWGDNLDCVEEYQKRLDATRKIADVSSLPLLVAEYRPVQPENCGHCFIRRLGATAGEGFPFFATTLTTSPHKDADVINDIGGRFDGYVATDFKKKNGFARSVELSKKYGLYRQNYCGCGRSVKNKFFTNDE